MIKGIFLSLVLSLTPNLNQYSCTDFDSNTLIRNEIMLQINEGALGTIMSGLNWF